MTTQLPTFVPDSLVIPVEPIQGLNTSTLTEGAIIYLSETTGAMTTTRPTAPAHNTDE
jgi:hypothetical protein